MHLDNCDSAAVIYSSFQGDADYAELLPMFVDELPGVRATLHDLGGAGDFDRLQREAHKLRGSAGGYGFQGLSDLAGCLEDSCRNPIRDPASILRNLDQLLDHLNRVRA